VTVITGVTPHVMEDNPWNNLYPTVWHVMECVLRAIRAQVNRNNNTNIPLFTSETCRLPCSPDILSLLKTITIDSSIPD